MGWYSESARLLHFGHITRTCLVYEGRCELFANLKDLQNVIKDKWHDVDDQTMRKAILQWKRFQQQWQSRMEDLFSTFSANQLTDDQLITVTFWCGLMRTSDDMNDALLANIVL